MFVRGEGERKQFSTRPEKYIQINNVSVLTIFKSVRQFVGLGKFVCQKFFLFCLQLNETILYKVMPRMHGYILQIFFTENNKH